MGRKMWSAANRAQRTEFPEAVQLGSLADIKGRENLFFAVGADGWECPGLHVFNVNQEHSVKIMSAL
jgi:hypothetical protein